MPSKPREPAPTPAPLPPGLDLLWGRRVPGQRGPKRGLTVDAIVATAIGIADSEGLDAVSMARVAQDLSFTPMSLYRYVTNKDELLQLMWNASARGAEGLVLDGDGWRERLRHWAFVQREMLDRHPWITQMPMAAPPLAPNSLRFVERGLETLAETGLRDEDQLRVIGLLSSYTLSEARMAHDAARAVAAAAVADPTASWPSFEGLLRQLIDEPTYPILHRIAWSDSVGDAPSGFEEHEEFAFGIERILDGVQVLIDASAKPRRRLARAAASRGGQPNTVG